MQWIDNPNVMVRFPEEHLDDMNNRLTSFARSFVEYDLEVSDQAQQKGIIDKKKPEIKKDSIYI